MIDLTPAERLGVARTWSVDFNAMYDLAIAIYEQLFVEDPSILSMFPCLDHSASSIRKNKTFSGMAMSFVRVMAVTIRYMDNLRDAQETLAKMGTFHSKFCGRGMKIEHWDSMNRAIKFAVFNHIRSMVAHDQLTKDEINDCIEGWTKLIDFITETIKTNAHGEQIHCSHVDLNTSKLLISDSQPSLPVVEPVRGVNKPVKNTRSCSLL